MDTQTLHAYDSAAADFVQEWNSQPPPLDMQTLLRRFFKPGRTADIGCGGGRDTAWLDANGFPAVGYDASEGLLAEARRLHPSIQFVRASLPELSGIDDGGFVNVLCETVIMHLDPASVTPAVRRLMSILEPGGTLYLSWRVTEHANRRDDHGRLYAAFDPMLALQGLDGAAILFDEQRDSESSGKLVRRIIARKAGTPD
jgi:SAM-dependent methyltransferase